MNKNYLIAGIVIVIILSIGAYFQIQGNKKMYEELGINKNQNNMEENQNVSLPEGLKIEILKEGTGQAAKNGDTVSVHYVGTLEKDGTKFDSSIDRGAPFLFELGAGKVIQGWDLGVVGMKVGEKRKLIISPDLAYGPNDYSTIPGNSTLIFEVELLGINQ